MKKLLINTYTPSEVRIWCRLFWSKDEDLDIEELQEDLYQFELEPPKPPKPESPFSDMLKDYLPGQIKPTPEPAFKRPEYPPSWYVYDIQETGLRDVIDPGRMQNWGDSFDAWAFWALGNGLAPLQPFLLSIPRPYYPGPDYWGEYDGPEYEHAVVDRIPLKDSRALKQWERYLKNFGWRLYGL
jgi:hypothetical protein